MMKHDGSAIDLNADGTTAFRRVQNSLKAPRGPMLKSNRGMLLSPIPLLLAVIFFVPGATSALGSSPRQSENQEEITTYTGRTMAFEFSDLLGSGEYSTVRAGQESESGTDRIGTLVVFWSIHCSHCIAETPTINSLYAAWAPRGLLVVGVPQDDRPEDIIRISDVFGITWPQFFESGAADEKPMAREWEIDVVPTFFLLDEKGVVIDYGFRDLSTTLDRHFH